MKNIILILFAVSILSCKTNSDDKSSSTIPNNKVFVVDKDFCKEMDLPIIEFSLEYPRELETDPPEKGYRNIQYNAFLKLNENDIQTEVISLGYYKISESSLLKNQLKKNILTQILKAYEQAYEFSEANISIFEIDNKEYLMLRAKGKSTDPDVKPFYEDNYLIQILLLEPQPNNKYGLLIVFIANEESEIKSYEDFATKGFISEVWQTLEFN